VGKRGKGKPDRAGEAEQFSTDEEPIEDADLEKAIERFIDAFVIKTKQERAGLLLRARSERRDETLQRLPSWVAPGLQTELEGNADSPQHVQRRFGALRGVLIDYRGARRMTIAGALWMSKVKIGFATLFISDAGSVALLVPETGRSILCVRS